MLSYFIKYKGFINQNLFIPLATLFTPVLGMENKIQVQAEAKFNQRLRERLEAQQ